MVTTMIGPREHDGQVFGTCWFSLGGESAAQREVGDITDLPPNKPLPGKELKCCLGTTNVAKSVTRICQAWQLARCSLLRVLNERCGNLLLVLGRVTIQFVLSCLGCQTEGNES